MKISVTDDGGGIPSSERVELFELGKRGSTEAEGSGIGLGLVRLFVERAGGEITVGDSASGGAAFCVLLPRIAQAKDSDQARNSTISVKSCRKPLSSDIV